MLYAPRFNKKLLSISIMDDKGFVGIPNTTLRIGVRDFNLYMLQGNPVKALVHDNDKFYDILHRRVGHTLEGTTISKGYCHWSSIFQCLSEGNMLKLCTWKEYQYSFSK